MRSAGVYYATRNMDQPTALALQPIDPPLDLPVPGADIPIGITTIPVDTLRHRPLDKLLEFRMGLLLLSTGVHGTVILIPVPSPRPFITLAQALRSSATVGGRNRWRGGE